MGDTDPLSAFNRYRLSGAGLGVIYSAGSCAVYSVY